MKKTILFCGNGLSAEILPQVCKWGYDIIVLTDFIHEPNLKYAKKIKEIETKDPLAALTAAKELVKEGYDFDGVLSLCWDSSISVSTIAQYYNLQAVSLQTAIASTNKIIRSKMFKEANIPSPAFFVINSFKELQERKEINYPIILKPSNLSSSKGVIKVDSARDLLEAYNYVSSFSKGGDIVVNEFISGTEHSVEGLMIDGKLHPTALSDRLFLYEECFPHFVEIGDIMPSSLTNEQAIKMYKVVEEAAISLGIVNGVAKADMKLQNGEPIVLEIASRLGGPRFGTEMVPLSNGTNILKAAIQQALREPIDLSCLHPLYSKGMVNRSIFPIPGKVISISGLDSAKKMPGFYDFKWWRPEGLSPDDIIQPYKNGCGDVGYIIAIGANRAEAISNADRIEKSIIIVTETTK